MPEARTENRMLGGMAGRYATALFELARDAGAIDRVATELDTITALLRESPDLRRLAPIKPRSTRPFRSPGSAGRRETAVSPPPA